MVYAGSIERRKQIGVSVAEFAIANGATHFCTLKPGIRGLLRFDPDQELRPVVGAFFKEYARVRNSIPWRRAVSEGDLPFVAGVPEQRDRFGNLDPHFHFMIALRDGEEALFRGFARRRWGIDMTEGAAELPAVAPASSVPPGMRDFLFPETVPVDTDPRRWLFRGARYAPSFDLQSISATPARIGTYMTKQSDSPIIWNHLEIFDAAKPPANQRNKTPSRRRA